MGWTGVLGEKEFAALHELKKSGKSPKLRGTMLRIGEDRAYLSLPRGKAAKAPKSAVLVIHEWWGLNDNIKHWADRLAADGHAALAVDLYGGVVAKTRDDALSAMRAVDAEAATKTLLAAHRFLKDDERVRATKRACIGWCFGGGWSLKLAMAAPDLDAAVIYYGRLVEDQERLAPIKARVLGVFGNLDRGIPPKSVDAFEASMKKAKKSVEILRYDANHAFANPSSARYDEKNAAAAWKRVRAFLTKNLAEGSAAGTEISFTANARDFKCVLPAGWSKKRPRMMRNIDIAIEGADVQCYISVLGGGAGGVAPNVNRWCAQLGRDEMTEAEIEKLPRIDMLGQKAIYAPIQGAFTKRGDVRVEDAKMIGVLCALEGQVLFVKIIGARADVDRCEADFKAFCKSIR